MIWALIEVVLPMLLTFLFGLLFGWLWWRRRTTRSEFLSVGDGVVDSNSGDKAAQDELVDEDGSRQDRFMQEQALAKELTSANASIRSLVAELDVTRTRLQSSENRLAASGVEISATAAMNADGSVSDERRETRDPEISTESLSEDITESVSSRVADRDSSAALEQLRVLRQKYQELETSQSIDKAELAKKDHLESRLNNLTRELTENKNELAEAKKSAAQLQAEVDALTQAESDGSQRSIQPASDGHDASQSDEIAQLKTQLAEITPAAEQARDYQSQVAALQAKLQQSESKVRQIEQSGERIDQLDSQLHSRLADELEKAQQRVEVLEQKAGQSADKSAELVRIRSRVATLESELGEASSRAEDADKLQRRVTELETMLKGSEVKVANERLVESEAQLRIANNRVAEQQQQISRLQNDSSDSGKVAASANVESEKGAEATSLRRQRGAISTAVAEEGSTSKRKHRSGIGAYLDASPSDAGSSDTRSSVANAATGHTGAMREGFDNDHSAKESAEKSDETAHISAGDNGSTAEPLTTDDQSQGSVTEGAAQRHKSESGAAGSRQGGGSAAKAKVEPAAWHAGVTRFGTPAARHKDDLKVIRGIGPVLEKTLNEAEIQTWDQLAALQADEVELIEQSMDFPGRMTRENWVEQATELVALYPETEGRPSGKKLLPRKG